MKIRKEIASRHWMQAAIEETERGYKDRGYSTEREKKIGKLQADLIARKGKELIVFEFKSDKWTNDRKQIASQLRNYVAREGGRFKLVFVSPPEENKIDIEDLDSILLAEIEDRIGETEVSTIATHVTAEEVEESKISDIFISKENIKLEGEGFASFSLQYGSSSDMQKGDGASMAESFPFYFEITLDHNLQVIKVDSLEIDVSDFYE